MIIQYVNFFITSSRCLFILFPTQFFTIFCNHFQPVTFRNRFTSFIFFPSAASNFSRLHFVTDSLPSFFSLFIPWDVYHVGYAFSYPIVDAVSLSHRGFCRYKKLPLLLLSILNHNSQMLNTKSHLSNNHFADLGKMVTWLITSVLTGSYGFFYDFGKVPPISVA